jgi:Domain of unknown function (DUF4112)
MAQPFAWTTRQTTIEPTPEIDRTERDRIVRRLQRLSWLLDEAVKIPGTRITLGWDSVLGIVPVVGDGITTVFSAYFLWEASRLGLSTWTLMKMLGNVGVDFVVGTIPVVGDLVDIGWRANRRNLLLLYRMLEIDPSAGPGGKKSAFSARAKFAPANDR